MKKFPQSFRSIAIAFAIGIAVTVSPPVLQASMGPGQPEIVILGNGVEIIAGDSTPRVANGTDFGSGTVRDGPLVRNFTVQNSGTAALTVTAVHLAGPGAAAFTVRGLAFPEIIEVGGRRTLTVTFDPVAPGIFSATVSVASDDEDENPSTWTLQAVRLDSPPVAREDHFDALADVAVAIPVRALLANDDDPDGAPLSMVDHDPSTSMGGRSITLSPDRTLLTLIAAADSLTEDTFTYRVTDGTSTAQATVRLRLQPVPLVYEGFEYPAGQHLATPGATELPKNGGLGWAGPWTTLKSFLVFPISPTSLAYSSPGFPTRGGAIVRAGSASRAIRPISLAVNQELWFSALLQGAAAAPGDVIMEFGFDGVSLRLSTGNNTGGLPLNWGLTAYYSTYGAVAVPDRATLLVAKVRRTTESHYDFSLFVDPPPGSEPPATSVGHGYDRLGGYNLLRDITLTDGGGSPNIDRAGFDEIRIGRSYRSVTTGNPFLVASENEIRVVPASTLGKNFTLPFGAVAAGTYVLERKALTCSGPTSDWLPVARQEVTEAGLVTFVDAPSPCGAIYRVRLP